jgi:hypothetical protein
VPRAGAGARMGWDGDDLFYLAYWYPQMTVYDDVVGWHPDPFVAVTEFHSHFATTTSPSTCPSSGWSRARGVT